MTPSVLCACAVCRLVCGALVTATTTCSTHKHDQLRSESSVGMDEADVWKEGVHFRVGSTTTHQSFVQFLFSSLI